MDEKVITKTLSDGATATAMLHPIGGRYTVAELHIVAGPSGAITKRGMLQVSLVEIEAEANPDWPDVNSLPPLRRAPEMTGDEFSRLFVKYYCAWSLVAAHPVAAMRDAYKIKQTTLHTWLREARLRGLLPAVRSTKAG